MWSSGFIGARLGTEAAGTVPVLMWRFLILAGLLLAWGAVRRSLPSGRDLAVESVVGLLAQGVYLGGAVLAIELGVAVGTTALIAALQPIIAGALAGPVLGERVGGRQWLGLGLGLAGVVLVVGGEVQVSGAPGYAYVLPFLGTLGLVAATLLEARMPVDAPIADRLAIQCAVSALLFGAFGLILGQAAPGTDGQFWLAIAWFIVLSTVGGYGLYWANLERGSVTRVSSLIYLTPPTVMVWAFLMFGETVRPSGLAGLAVCFGAVLLVRSRGGRGRWRRLAGRTLGRDVRHRLLGQRLEEPDAEPDHHQRERRGGDDRRLLQRRQAAGEQQDGCRGAGGDSP
jgi:drug/metabolite transporter (DMT)-like permease